MQIDMRQYLVITAALNKLQVENKLLKEKIKTMELKTISADVANQIDDWLSQPYHGKSERKDIENFATEITKYIDSQLKT